MTFASQQTLLRYTPCGSFWVRAIPFSDKGAVSTLLEMGVTQTLFDREIHGEIDTVTTNQSSSSVSLNWSGLKITDGDELYHTIWSNIEGVKQMDVRQLLPFVSENCIIEMREGRPPEYGTCEEQWLLRINVDGGNEKLATAPTLLTEEQVAML